MYVKSALLASVALLGKLNAQTLECITCTNTQPLTGIGSTGNDGDCYFSAVTLDNIAKTVGASSVAACTGSCWTQYFSKDGVIQSVARGCLAAGAASAAQTGVDLGTQGTDLKASGCDSKIKTLSASTVDFTLPNLGQNDLTEVTCAKTCSPVDGQGGCNGAADDVSTLSDCSTSQGGHGLCGAAGVCDHWTGDCTFSCAANERPVLVSGTFECTAYDNTACNNVDCTADSTGVTGTLAATCVGDGTVGSVGACVCTSAATLYSNAACVATTAAPVVTAAPTTNRLCVQCSSDIDSSDACAQGTTAATECPGATDICSAVATFWVNDAGESVREVIERGCTPSTDGPQFDTCEFNTISTLAVDASQSSMISSASTEVACRYTCDTDNCNTATPDGIDSTFVATSTCHVGSVCTDLTSCALITDFATHVDQATNAAPTSCAANNMCEGTMKYMTHTRYDGQIERALIHLSFACADVAVTTESNQCTSATIGTNYATSGGVAFVSNAQTNDATEARGNTNFVTCSTICAGDNCNNNWPGQPKCHVCDLTDAAVVAANPDHCYTDVSAAQACPNYYDNACFVMQSGLDLTSNWAQKSQNQYSAMQSMGAYRSISRGCEEASAEGTTEGTSVTRDSAQAQTYHQDRKHTCVTSGCNFGPALPTPDN